MENFTVTFKNCPPDVKVMVETTFETAPAIVTGKELDKTDQLEIDFNAIDEPTMAADIMNVIFTILMAHSWLQVKSQRDEG